MYNKIGYFKDEDKKDHESILQKIKGQWNSLDSLTDKPHKLQDVLV